MGEVECRGWEIKAGGCAEARRGAGGLSVSAESALSKRIITTIFSSCRTGHGRWLLFIHRQDPSGARLCGDPRLRPDAADGPDKADGADRVPWDGGGLERWFEAVLPGRWATR